MIGTLFADFAGLAASSRSSNVSGDMREIRCEDLAELAAAFPLEIAVFREMLEEVEEIYLEQAA
jgi:hypothetical protein